MLTLVKHKRYKKSMTKREQYPFKKRLDLSARQREKLEKLSAKLEESANAVIRKALNELYEREFPDDKDGEP